MSFEQMLIQILRNQWTQLKARQAVLQTDPYPVTFRQEELDELKLRIMQTKQILEVSS